MISIANQVCYLRATSEYIPQIVSMHKTYIAQEDLHEFQDLYLEYYYQTIINSNDYVIIALSENKVIGFCTLVTNQRNILIDLMKKRFRDFFKLPLKYWGSVLSYILNKLVHEIFGGKWGNSEISQYRSCNELRAIATEPQYRRAQVGTKLLQYCVQLAREAKKMPIIAWVKENNDKSINLFLKNGFQKAAVRDDKFEKVFLFLLKS